MRTYALENRGRAPLYEYLYRCIRGDILDGTLTAGERLPSKRALARHLEVAVATVENAYSQLVAEGYLYAEEKRGYFVSPLETGDRPRPAEAVHASGPACALPMPQRDWLLDLTSGGAGTEGFPFTVWARLMRRVLTDRGEQLLRSSPHNGVEELRRLVWEDLDQAMILGLEMTVEELRERGAVVHQNTQGTLDDLRRKLR